jgi:hypothetical protein
MTKSEGSRSIIIERWDALRSNGVGFCESYQEGQAIIGDGRVPFTRETTDYVTREMLEKEGRIPVSVDYTGDVMPYIDDHFGTNFRRERNEGFEGKGKLFLLLKNLGRRYRLQGELISYGETHMDTSGRTNIHFWYIRGDYYTLSLTIDEVENNPFIVREFVGRVFDWDNVAYEEGMSSWADHPQLDLVSDTDIIDILRLEKDYGWVKKRKIRKLGYNPEVTKVGVRW